MKDKIKSYLLIVLGNVLFAFSVSIFVIPYGFISSGVTGLALIIEYFTDFNLIISVAVINIIMLGIGAFVLGKYFFITTVASTFLYPIFLSLFTELQKTIFFNLTDDLLLAAIFAGITGGFGVGIVLKQGASTGGMDIPPLIVNKYTGFSLSVLIYFVDVLVLCGQVFFADIESILYGIIIVALFAIIIDRILLIGKRQIQVLIISPKYLEINHCIQKELDRGTTYLHMTTGYLNHDQKALLSIISKQQLIRVNQLIKAIDSTAFMIVSEVHEVKGRGFDLSKDYLSN